MGGWQEEEEAGIGGVGGWKGTLTLRQDARECCIDEVVWILDRLDVRCALAS